MKNKRKPNGAESWRIEKYLKNAEKFNYPGSSLSNQAQESLHFATIDNKSLNNVKKWIKLTSATLAKNLNKKDTESIKSGEYNIENWINLINVKDIQSKNYRTIVKAKRKSNSSDSATKKKLEKAYKVKHNNSKKRSSSKKNKVKPANPRYQLSSYATHIKKPSDIEGKQHGLSTRDRSIKLVNFIDMTSIK